MTCKDCIDYKRCLKRGDKDTLNLNEGMEECRGFASVDVCKELISHIGETVYKICPKCNDQHNGSCENCSWRSAIFTNGCNVFGLWKDGQYPADKCTIVPFYIHFNSIPTIANQLGKKCFFTKEEAEKALEIDEVMEATYTVTTNGKVYKWSFTESKSEDDYGNGIYIAVKSPSGDVFSYDCRYMIGYEFHKACVDYLLAYYGENLDELSEDD